MITLGEILKFPRSTEPPMPVQIVVGDDDWEEFTELRSDSPLLTPVEECEVTELSAEKSISGTWGPVLRIGIDFDKDKLCCMWVKRKSTRRNSDG